MGLVQGYPPHEYVVVGEVEDGQWHVLELVNDYTFSESLRTDLLFASLR